MSCPSSLVDELVDDMRTLYGIPRQGCIAFYIGQNDNQRCPVRLYLQLFVGRRMSVLHCLRLLANSGVQRILCCIYILFFFVLCNLCCQFFWIVLFWLPLRYSLSLFTQKTKDRVIRTPLKTGGQRRSYFCHDACQRCGFFWHYLLPLHFH